MVATGNPTPLITVLVDGLEPYVWFSWGRFQQIIGEGDIWSFLVSFNLVVCFTRVCSELDVEFSQSILSVTNIKSDICGNWCNRNMMTWFIYIYIYMYIYIKIMLSYFYYISFRICRFLYLLLIICFEKILHLHVLGFDRWLFVILKTSH